MRAAWLFAFAACGFSPGAGIDATGGGGGDVGSDVGSDAGMDAGSGSGSGSNATGAWRKAITIHAASVTGTQQNFPVWIDLDAPDIAARALASGADISFTNATGGPLDFEIQRWDRPGHRLQAWVRVPTLAHADLTLFVVYGDPTHVVAPNPTGVWGGYKAVWHLDDDASTNAVHDATSTYDATATNVAAGAHTGGQLGNGVHFDGSGTSVITYMNPLTGNGAHTISAWVDQGNATHTSAIVTLGVGDTDKARFLYGRYGTGATIGVGQYNDDWAVGNDIEGDGWVLLHWVHEGTNKKTHIYRNGVELTMTPHMFDNAANTTGGMTGMIGNAPSPEFGANNGMLGTIDEVRIASGQRDASWIATEFANQSDPGSFYAVSTEMLAP